jgi:8-amino-7-oxononanoate synthase
MLSKKLEELLRQRNDKGLLRTLKTFPSSLTDFSSNDYLGFSTCGLLEAATKKVEGNHSKNKIGSGGSRLLTGNSDYVLELENKIAAFHSSESALIFNSGYDANLGFFSCVPQKGDLIFYDELVHASIIDGMRLSHASSYKFKHSDIADLKKKIALQPVKDQTIFIAVESVYSMDGDTAPLKELAAFCTEHNYNLVVDEAHAIGVFGKEGRGLCDELTIANQCFARLYTYGKAMGTHGAAICGSKTLTNFLVNFSRPFIFSTALPFPSLYNIEAAYNLLRDSTHQNKLKENISFFNETFSQIPSYKKSDSAIHAVIIPGNENVQQASAALIEKGFDVRAVKSPTVKEGTERLRISLHAFNTKEEMNNLFLALSSLQVLPG